MRASLRIHVEFEWPAGRAQSVGSAKQELLKMVSDELFALASNDFSALRYSRISLDPVKTEVELVVEDAYRKQMAPPAPERT